MEIIVLLAGIVLALFLAKFVLSIILGASLPLHVTCENAIYQFIKREASEPVAVSNRAIKEIAQNIAEVANDVSLIDKQRSKHEIAYRECEIAAINILQYKQGKDDFLAAGPDDPEEIKILKKYDAVNTSTVIDR